MKADAVNANPVPTEPEVRKCRFCGYDKIPVDLVTVGGRTKCIYGEDCRNRCVEQLAEARYDIKCQRNWAVATEKLLAKEDADNAALREMLVLAKSAIRHKPGCDGLEISVGGQPCGCGVFNIIDGINALLKSTPTPSQKPAPKEPGEREPDAPSEAPTTVPSLTGERQGE